MKFFCKTEQKDVFFEDLFPEPRTVFRSHTDATLLDFLIEPEAYFIVNKREMFTYDLLIQPDVREMIKIAGWGNVIRPAVNLKKKEAEALRERAVENFKKALPDIKAHLEDAEMKEIERAIFWGNPAVLTRNLKHFIRFFDPLYLPSRKGLLPSAHRTFAKMKYR